MGWANKLIGWTNSTGAEVNSEGALYTVSLDPSGAHYTVASKTATMAAALVANSTIFVMRLSPTSPLKAWIDSIRIRWTTIAAFTTPVTQNRSIVLVRGNGAASTGGTSLPVATRKDSDYASSGFDTANGGDMRISSTGALTTTGITFDNVYLGEVTLAHVGAAGAFYETVYELSVRNHPIELHPGELFAIRNINTLDAGGTWSLGIEVNWRESSSEG